MNWKTFLGVVWPVLLLLSVALMFASISAAKMAAKSRTCETVTIWHDSCDLQLGWHEHSYSYTK